MAGWRGDWESQWGGGGAHTGLTEKVRLEPTLRRLKEGAGKAWEGGRISQAKSGSSRQARAGPHQQGWTQTAGNETFVSGLFIQVRSVHPQVFKTSTTPRNKIPSIRRATVPFLSATHFCEVASVCLALCWGHQDG